MKHEPQKTLTSFIEDNGEAERALSEGAMCELARKEIKRPKFNIDLMEEVLDRNNLNAAFKRVKRNKGAAGIDGMKVGDLKSYLHESFQEIKEALLTGNYQPSAVRKVEIPKPNGGIRQLGIPTVMDRFIQQALAQVLQRGFDPTFSDSSFGFRPQRSAHGAITKSKCIQNEGYHSVVDIDLAKFFDEVNHDKLMSKLSKVIDDKRVLKLVRKFLQAGILDDGLITTPDKGTPQGGPLSPLLSNIVLDELDKELEARGHKFVRYADDCQIYVKSDRAGIRVMASITMFIEKKLQLRINRDKSSVTIPSDVQFLGFSFSVPSLEGKVKTVIGSKSLKRFKDRIRVLTRSRKRVSFETFIKDLSLYINGWKGYFVKADWVNILRYFDSWIRRRVRCFIWQQWRRGQTKVKKLMKYGINRDLARKTAGSGKGDWRLSQSPALCIAFPKSYFDKVGLPKLYKL
jgi:RNA-directed DNA polymerase